MSLGGEQLLASRSPQRGLALGALWICTVVAAFYAGRFADDDGSLQRLQRQGEPSAAPGGHQGEQQLGASAAARQTFTQQQGSSALAAVDALAAHPRVHTRGFYSPGHDSYLVALAKADPLGTTDKFTAHVYEALYGRLLEMAPGRHRVHKMLEIGLGCNMGTGPAVGASARLWRRYFPHAEVWFAEYDARCVQAREQELQAMGINVVIGDQEDPVVLAQWVNQTGGGFDLIIDDGGHYNAQQFQSFMHLFQHALKPGGAYVIEDMNWSRSFGCVPTNPRCVVMVEALMQWIDFLIFRHCNEVWDKRPPPGHLGKVTRPEPFYPMPPGIRSIECSAEACVVIKCFAEDTTCWYRGCVDMGLAERTPWNASIYN